MLPINGTVLGRPHDRLARTPKPSLSWLGEVARRNGLAPQQG